MYEFDMELCRLRADEATARFLKSRDKWTGDPPVANYFDDMHENQRVVGTLKVNSGRLAVDAVYNLSCQSGPLNRAVLPGDYEVFEWLRGSGVRFCSNKVDAWELATKTGEDATDLLPGQISGFGTDNAEFCYVDYDSAMQHVQMHGENGFDDFSLSESREWRLDCEPDANVILINTGSDGRFASYWGLDAVRNPVVLVTQFEERRGQQVVHTFKNIRDVNNEFLDLAGVEWSGSQLRAYLQDDQILVFEEVGRRLSLGVEFCPPESTAWRLMSAQTSYKIDSNHGISVRFTKFDLGTRFLNAVPPVRLTYSLQFGALVEVAPPSALSTSIVSSQNHLMVLEVVSRLIGGNDFLLSDEQYRILMQSLSEEQRTIAELRFGITGKQLGLEDVGEKVGRSGPEVREEERWIIRKLRESYFEVQGLR